MFSLMKAALALALLLASGKDQYPGPKCLGPFCVDEADSGKGLFERLGTPAKVEDTYCYTGTGGFLHVGMMPTQGRTRYVDDVLLSDFPNCLHMPKDVTQTTRQDLREWRTPEKIGLGSSEDDVIRAYGKPNYVHKLDARKVGRVLLGYRSGDAVPDVGEKSLEYRVEDRTRSAEFGIRNGTVAWIAMFR
jgi:hypothetical protein